MPSLFNSSFLEKDRMIFSHAIIITHFENTVPGTVFSKRSTCCLFLTQVFRKRQNDIFACDNYHTFREYGPSDISVGNLHQKSWKFFRRYRCKFTTFWKNYKIFWLLRVILYRFSSAIYIFFLSICLRYPRYLYFL